MKDIICQELRKSLIKSKFPVVYRILQKTGATSCIYIYDSILGNHKFLSRDSYYEITGKKFDSEALNEVELCYLCTSTEKEHKDKLLYSINCYDHEYKY